VSPCIRAAREENTTYLTELRAFDNQLETDEVELKQRHGRPVEGAWDDITHPPPPPTLAFILHTRGVLSGLLTPREAVPGTVFTSLPVAGETKKRKMILVTTRVSARFVHVVRGAGVSCPSRKQNLRLPPLPPGQEVCFPRAPRRRAAR